MSQTAQLNALFEAWQTSNPLLKEHGFSRDGIVCEERFAAAQRRCLFLLKEPHDHSEDLREHAKWCLAPPIGKEKIRSYPTWRNLARWSHGVLHGFPALSKEPVPWNDLLEIAVMNLKKTPGGSSAKYKELRAFSRDPVNKRFIKEELELIAPEVVVCCGRQVADLLREVLDVPRESQRFFRWNSIPILEHRHPDRCPVVESYQLLSHLCRSAIRSRTG
jgi:hypothetical protein